MTLKIDWSQAPLLMNRSLLTDLFRNEHCAHSNCRPRQALGLMSYPPGKCIGTKPNAAETEPSATSTEEPIGGFLISLKSLGIWGPWILKWITSADNPGGQCNSGKALPTCMLLLSSHKSFYVSNNVTTPFGGHHCPWRLRHYSLLRPSLSLSSVPIYRPLHCTAQKTRVHGNTVLRR